MKNLVLCLLFLSTLSTQVSGQDRWLYWKYKDYNNSFSFTIPRLAISTGSMFVGTRDERRMVRRIHKVRALIFDQHSPVTQRDVKRFYRKAHRRHLEELITVREGKTNVSILAKMRRNTLRKVVVMVNSPEEGMVLVSVKGRLRWKDIMKTLEKIDEKDGSDNKHMSKVLKNLPEEI
jgi:L-rhamnose mutarotase